MLCRHKRIEETVVSPISIKVESVPVLMFPEARLPGNDSRCQEEQDLLRRDADVCPLEEVADQRQAANQRYLRHVDTLLCHDHAADDHRPSISNQYFRLRGLRVQRRNTLNSRNAV